MSEKHPVFGGVDLNGGVDINTVSESQTDVDVGDKYVDLDEHRGSFSGVYLGHNGWANGKTDFSKPNLGTAGSKQKKRSSLFGAETEEQKLCRRRLYIALAILITLTVIVSVALIFYILNK